MPIPVPPLRHATLRDGSRQRQRSLNQQHQPAPLSRQGRTPLPSRATPSYDATSPFVSNLPLRPRLPYVMPDAQELELLVELSEGLEASPTSHRSRRARPLMPPPLPLLVGPPALFPAPWALMPGMILTDAERQEAVCAISLLPLAELDQPIGLRLGRAVHVFAWQMLEQWLRQSSGYRHQDGTFKNPIHGVWMPRSALRRIVMPNHGPAIASPTAAQALGAPR